MLPGTVNDLRYLTTFEVAADMRLHVKTVRCMFERGEIPGTKVAGRWYTTRQVLDKLLAGELP